MPAAASIIGDILNLSKDDGYVIENWDTEGNVPYVTKNGSFYCGYDNPRSIAAKGEWILKNWHERHDVLGL